MNKNIMKKWVKVLRSGKYKQGQGLLKQTTEQNKTSHCCLGVLCEIYNEDMRKNKKKTLPEKINDGMYEFNKHYVLLPKPVQKWAGLFGQIGEFINVDTKFGSLAEMNDHGYGFKKIANIIEKRWENL